MKKYKITTDKCGMRSFSYEGTRVRVPDSDGTYQIQWVYRHGEAIDPKGETSGYIVPDKRAINDVDIGQNKYPGARVQIAGNVVTEID